jgi:hypothetical protein
LKDARRQVFVEQESLHAGDGATLQIRGWLELKALL